METERTEASPLIDHFSSIDAARGIAAICVVIFHYHQFYLPENGGPTAFTETRDFPYGSVLWPIFELGEEAIRLFWVISGFVFAHVYWHRETTVRQFAVARFARLYLLHFVTLLTVAGLQILSFQMAGHWQIFGNNDLKQFALQILLVDHSLNFSNGTSFNGPIWSVSAEMFAYAVFFFTLPLTKRSPLGVSMMIAVTSFLILIVRPENMIIGRWAFICAVFFFAGAATYAVYRILRGQPKKVFAATIVLAISALVGATLGSLSTLILLSCCAIILGLSAFEKPANRPGGVFGFLGDISYSIYLVHVPIQIIVLIVADLAFNGDRTFAQSHFTLPAFLAVSIGVAYATNLYFEKPAGRWLRFRLGKVN